MSKHLKLTHFLLAAGIAAFSILCLSCNNAPLINLDEYTADVQVLPSSILTDGTIISYPAVCVRVSHPEAAKRLMQINAYAFGERLSGTFRENETGTLELKFDCMVNVYDGHYNPELEKDVRITVVYGFDGSGGGPKTIYEQSFPIEFYVIGD